MFINITASETGNNKGSSGALVNYLEKENQMQTEKGRALGQENWFNGSDNQIRRQEVRMKIDRNIAKLGRNDSKFFLVNISPSQKELAHLYEKFGEAGAKEKLKEFAVKIMDGYAKNFKRTGIDSNRDLLWFGKAENYRYYKHTDREVKDGTRQTGERKEGRQMHIQIIVSRKDISNTIKLSPQNTSKGKNTAHSAKLGQFDRTAFKQIGEILFDEFFGFDRGLKDTLSYANTMKNGTTAQKAQMQVLRDISLSQHERLDIINDLSKGVADGLFENIGQMIDATAQKGSDLLVALMEPVYVASETNPIEEAEKRRRKKKENLDQSQGLSR
ncbi:DUF5712 family protein [Pedobacter psychroterrae]|uniref:Molybdopterin-guanine dinucleotide biosynthesis protein MobB n=1 Tax=Pedobacter psychroterrae TaxID=2530453 RepID=A0A4R0N9C1_9SPHI|nr:DUF5712 family protein [Pedobacter psychroterrae]TCC96788.1 molybdopterin-guanine dinucleotide biosynthesis protein MobB [Pedobacter psychroterrae]